MQIACRVKRLQRRQRGYAGIKGSVVWKWNTRVRSCRKGGIKENPYRRASKHGWNSKEQPTGQKYQEGQGYSLC